jgi:uncharacterized membrane protein YphA (DoxX/SURF4 family)
LSLENFVVESRSQTVRRVILALLRIYFGVVLLKASWGKITGDFTPRLAGFVGRNVENASAHGFYIGFLESVVLPNAAQFAFLVMWAEFLTGLALITGTATRLAAGVAMFLVLNFAFLKGSWFWSSSNDWAFFFIGLALLLGAAGRAFGADFYLARKWPKARIW